MANDSGVQPGWYADPLRRFELRYYNGAAWTADVSTGGDRFVDPMGVAVDPGGPQRSGGAGSVDGAGSVEGRGAGDGSNANPAATAAMVLGIIAIAVAWLPFVVVVGALAGILAVVFGVVGRRRAGPSGDGRSRATIGLITGTSALVAAVLGVVLTFIVLDEYDAYVDPSPHEVTITSCEVVGSRSSATGTLENLGTESTDFSVLIGFVRPGTDNPHRTSRVVLDEVGAGASADFEAERQVELDAVDCIVVEVTGPLPFGLSLD